MARNQIASVLLGAAFLVGFYAVPGVAQDWSPATREEAARMPEFCRRMTPEQAAAWRAKFGGLFVNHYCYGLKDLQRAAWPGASETHRNFHLNSAVAEFGSVLRAGESMPGHWFLPQVHLKKAQALSKLGRHAEARAEYERARIASQAAREGGMGTGNEALARENGPEKPPSVRAEAQAIVKDLQRPPPSAREELRRDAKKAVREAQERRAAE